jgi:hypothetical protein
MTSGMALDDFSLLLQCHEKLVKNILLALQASSLFKEEIEKRIV